MGKLKKRVKLKTHKGLSKVCTVRNSGSIKIGVAAANHNTAKRSAVSKRNKRKGNSMNNSDYKRVKTILGK